MAPGNDRPGQDPVDRDATAWIAAFADALGVDPPDAATVDTLLQLAGVAAHASQRTAAPIACYLVGVAGADAGRALADAEAVVRTAGGD